MALLDKKRSRQHAVHQAEEMLNSPDPWARVCDDLDLLGFAQDIDVASLVYITATSRLIERPLWSLVTGASGSGKSKIRGVIAECFPENDRLDISEMTPQALIRLQGAQGDGVDLQGVLLVKDERDRKAIDPGYLRSLYEDGYATKLVVLGGRSVWLTLRGRPALIETTTAVGVHDEDQNRRLILPVSESVEKVSAVLKHMANDAAGQREATTEGIRLRHQELQSLLPRSLTIKVPFANKLISDDAGEVAGPEATRAFQHLLSVTQTVALIRHRLREKRGDKELIASVDDYETAYGVLDPLLKSRFVGLSAQSAELLRQTGEAIRTLAISDPRRTGFSRKDLMA